jgi:hypothetical protein
MENKQGAVDWLIKLYQQTGKIDNFDLEVANEMFQEQIMKAYDDGAIDTMQEQEGLDISMDQNGEESERYYKENYGK